MKGQSEHGNPDWPKHVRVLSIEGMDNLGVDDAGQLYWKGEKIKTASQVELTTEQGWGAWILILSAAVLALIEAFRFFWLRLHLGL